MNFVDYLQTVHGNRIGKGMGEKSAKQYNNRLENMRKYGIYNEEDSVTPEIIKKIKAKYKDKNRPLPANNRILSRI